LSKLNAIQNVIDRMELMHT